MARIAGIDLPREKRIEIGLTYIYGIGRTSAKKILEMAQIDPDIRVKDLTEDQESALREVIDKHFTIDTVEKYVIAQKIERAKELLTYGELTLNEIADRLSYSSTAYLSAQFKSVTGLTPTQFRQQKEKRRRPLDEI